MNLQSYYSLEGCTCWMWTLGTFTMLVDGTVRLEYCSCLLPHGNGHLALEGGLSTGLACKCYLMALNPPGARPCGFPGATCPSGAPSCAYTSPPNVVSAVSTFPPLEVTRFPLLALHRYSGRATLPPVVFPRLTSFLSQRDELMD